MRSRTPSAAGRRKSPEAVTEQKTGYITADTATAKFSLAHWLRKFATIEARFEQAYPPQEG